MKNEPQTTARFKLSHGKGQGVNEFRPVVGPTNFVSEGLSLVHRPFVTSLQRMYSKTTNTRPSHQLRRRCQRQHSLLNSRRRFRGS